MAAITVRRSPGMALRTWEPFYSPLSLLEEMEDFTRDIWESPRWSPVVYGTGLTPRVDMFEDKSDLVLRAEFPGIKKEDIDISLEGDYFTLKAEKKMEEIKGATNLFCECCFGHYSRTVTLPYPVDTEKISATFENGLLEVRLPKTEEVKAKHIEVKVK